jgi:predicted RNase H-like HicB family nuclease
MQKTLVLTPLYVESDGWLVASIRELPRIHTQGRTRAEARDMLIDCVRTYYGYAHEQGEALPLGAESVDDLIRAIP